MTQRQRQQSKFGAKLFALRRQSYLSREQVAQRAGISVHLLQSLEQGRSANPTVQTVLGLACALRVPVSELIDCIAVDLEAGRSGQTASARVGRSQRSHPNEEKSERHRIQDW